MRSCCRAGLPALAFLLAVASLAAEAETRGEGELGGIHYRYRVPDAAQPGGAPLVVVLHGCRQGAEDIRVVTRFDALGGEAGFATLYPETSSSPVNPLGCWVWWDPENQTRGQGEPAAIVAVVERVRREAGADASRIYSDPPAECRDRYGWNFAHFLWHRRMSYAEYACDPWGASWRRSFNGAWGPGRCRE